jgi:hypothetical protein
MYIKFVVRLEKNSCNIYRILEHVTERKAGVKHGFFMQPNGLNAEGRFYRR